MLTVNKRKGILFIILGIVWIVFVYDFDNLIGRPTLFDTKAILSFLAGIICVVNGTRIYPRDVKK